MHATKAIQHVWHWWNGKDIEERFADVRQMWERLADDAIDRTPKPPKRVRIHIDANEYVSPFDGHRRS